MRIVVAVVAGLLIGTMGSLAPVVITSGGSSWFSSAALAQTDTGPGTDSDGPADEQAEPPEDLGPPLPTKKDEAYLREMRKRRLIEAGWKVFKAPEQEFSIALPGNPEVTAKPVAGHTPLIQHDYQVDPGDGTAYHVIVFEYPEGRAPDADVDYYRRLVDAYAKGSGSVVSKQGPRTLARLKGHEAVTVDRKNGLTHLIDLLPAGDRIYMLVTAGPPDHLNSEESQRFRLSFHLIDKDTVVAEDTEEEAVEDVPAEEELPPVEEPEAEQAPETPKATEEDLVGDDNAAEDETAGEDIAPSPQEPSVEETPAEDSPVDEAPAQEPAPEDAAPEPSTVEEAAPDEAAPDEPVIEEPAAEEPESEADDATEAPAKPDAQAKPKAPVPPMPDSDTVPEPDENAVEEMTPPAPSDENEAVEPPAAPESEPEASEPETKEPEAVEPDEESGAESQDEEPDEEETAPDSQPKHWNDDVDADEQFEI